VSAGQTASFSLKLVPGTGFAGSAAFGAREAKGCHLHQRLCPNFRGNADHVCPKRSHDEELDGQGSAAVAANSVLCLVAFAFGDVLTADFLSCWFCFVTTSRTKLFLQHSLRAAALIGAGMRLSLRG